MVGLSFPRMMKTVDLLVDRIDKKSLY